MSKRYFVLDAIRGFTLLSMIVYHAVWDFVYLFGFEWQWYQSKSAYLWQQSICWTFILLSGFCQPLGRKKWKRGFTIFLFGFLITIVTTAVMPENCVWFGVLTLIGSCMLLFIPAERILKKCHPILGFTIAFTLFVFTRNINEGFLGFGHFYRLTVPDCLYHNLITTYLGFPMKGFHSTDYFSLAPWIFLFVSGYFIHQFMAQKHLLCHLEPSRIKPVEWLGQHSLEIYLIHQPALYLFFTVLFSL